MTRPAYSRDDQPSDGDTPNWVRWLHGDDSTIVPRPKPARDSQRDSTQPPRDRAFPFHSRTRHPASKGRKTGWTGLWYFSTLLISLLFLYWLVQVAFLGSERETARKTLRTPQPSPKLKDSKTANPVLLASNTETAPPVNVESTIPLPPLPEPTSDPLVVPPPPPTQIELPMVELPRVELPQAPIFKPEPPLDLEPQADDYYTLEHPPFLALHLRGETPMLRNWKNLALLAATIMIVQPPVVQAQDTTAADIKSLLTQIESLRTTMQASTEGISKDIGTVKQDLTQANKSLSSVTADISSVKKDIATLAGNGLKQQMELQKTNDRLALVEKQLNSLSTELDSLKNQPSQPAPGLDKASVEEIRRKLAMIEQGLTKLQNKERISLSAPTTGRVVLINLYDEDLLFVINKTPHRVQANSSLPLEVPAGTLAYEVISGTWGRRAENTISLAANETFTLTAR